MTETNVVDSYEVSWHDAFALKNKTDIKPSYNIWLLESFTGYAERTYGMLLNGNRAVRVSRYSRTVEISAPRYVKTAF